MALTEDQVKTLTGLTRSAGSAKPLPAQGPNELPSAKKRGIAAIAFEVVKEPMFLLLLACGVIYLVLGDIQEAIMLLGFVVVIMGITIYQEQKTENTLEALRDLSSPRALVIRDGERRRIAGQGGGARGPHRPVRGGPRAGGCRSSSGASTFPSTSRC